MAGAAEPVAPTEADDAADAPAAPVAATRAGEAFDWPEADIARVAGTAPAAELEPERAPWWVSQPRSSTPAQGWWWRPRGVKTPVFLGHNYARAEVALVALVDAQYAPR